jgi:DNA polymerase-3 subunit beta
VLININQTTTPVVITPVDGILNQLILVMPVQLIGNNSTAMEEDTSDEEEVIVTENICSETEINEEINVAAEGGNTKEVVKEKNNLMNTDSSPQKNTVNTKTNSQTSANSTPKTRGRKKKVAVA